MQYRAAEAEGAEEAGDNQVRSGSLYDSCYHLCSGRYTLLLAGMALLGGSHRSHAGSSELFPED